MTARSLSMHTLIKSAKNWLRVLPFCEKFARIYRFLNAFSITTIISPVMSYVSAKWSNCDKELFFRVFKLQKRAARVILYAERMAPSVELFNRLKWIPFYEKCKIDKASIMFKPSYLNEHILINNSRHSRTTRYSNFNVLCPRYNRETEGGRTFLVTGTKIWNELPLRIRMVDSIRCFKHNMWTNIFSQQQFLSHFCV